MLDAETRLQDILGRIDRGEEVDKTLLRSHISQVREIVHGIATGPIDYQVVVDNLDDNILIADKDETILYVNPSYLKQWLTMRRGSCRMP